MQAEKNLKFQVFSVWILYVPLQVFFLKNNLTNVHYSNQFEKMRNMNLYKF